MKDKKKLRRRLVTFSLVTWVIILSIAHAVAQIYLHNRYFPHGDMEQVYCLFIYIILLTLPIYLVILKVEVIEHKERSETPVKYNHRNDLDEEFFNIRKQKTSNDV